MTAASGENGGSARFPATSAPLQRALNREPERRHDLVVVLRNMRKDAVCALLDRPTVALDEFRRSRTILDPVHRAVAEEAVELVDPMMTRIVLAIDVPEESMRVFHRSVPFAIARTCRQTPGETPGSTDNTDARTRASASRRHAPRPSSCPSSA